MNEKYAVLPIDVLARITPHEREQSEQFFKRSLEFSGDDGLNESLFSIAQFSTQEVDPITVSAWLMAQHQVMNTTVILSWQPSTAVSTSWEIFARYWSDFCYPASDDLTVWSESEDWCLLYHHEEFLQFGKRI